MYTHKHIMHAWLAGWLAGRKEGRKDGYGWMHACMHGRREGGVSHTDVRHTSLYLT